jgi:cytochrome c biogenesis protein CcmG/thiol:disulfide interchange protein DsbE
MRSLRMRLVGWLAVALLSLETTARDQKQPMIGEPAPAFSLKSLDGKIVSLEQQRGKFVVLHFAASW